MAVQNLAENAAYFSQQLRELSIAIDGDISKVIRTGVLKTFRNIIKRSPVKTGAYRGSHGISNAEPSTGEGIVKGKKGDKIPPPAPNWTWKVGDGDIWMFNNVPYAERIENGWSQQAPGGVYGLALVEITVFINAELAKYPALGPDGGGA
jgi:hypothetical protein